MKTAPITPSTMYANSVRRRDSVPTKLCQSATGSTSFDRCCEIVLASGMLLPGSRAGSYIGILS